MKEGMKYEGSMKERRKEGRKEGSMKEGGKEV